MHLREFLLQGFHDGVCSLCVLYALIGCSFMFGLPFFWLAMATIN